MTLVMGRNAPEAPGRSTNSSPRSTLILGSVGQTTVGRSMRDLSTSASGRSKPTINTRSILTSCLTKRGDTGSCLWGGDTKGLARDLFPAPLDELGDGDLALVSR